MIEQESASQQTLLQSAMGFDFGWGAAADQLKAVAEEK